MKIRDDERGFVLQTAVVILGIMVILGTCLTMTSSIELNIARNEKLAKTAFYRAENGRIIAAMALRSAEAGNTWSHGDRFDGNQDILITDGDFFAEGIDVGNSLDNVSTSSDIRITGSLRADIDIDKIEVGALPGAGSGFGSGYEGVGHAGMARAIYQIDSVGRDASGSMAQVRLQYRILPY